MQNIHGCNKDICHSILKYYKKLKRLYKYVILSRAMLNLVITAVIIVVISCAIQHLNKLFRVKTSETEHNRDMLYILYN